MSDSPPASVSTTSVTPPPRRRRRWLRVLVALVVLIVLLVLLLPTLLSIPPGKTVVLSIVNGQLNGKVEVGSWSLGWFTGIGASNVQVVDANKSPVVELRQFSTQLTLLKAITGHYTLGKTTIDGLRLHAKMDGNGGWNFSTLAKPSSKSEKSASSNANPASTPSKLPNLSGDIALTDAQATVEQPGKPTLTVPLSADVNIPDINGTITDKLDATVQIGSAAPGKIALAGTADAFKANQIASDSADVHQQLDLTGIDLQSLLPLLPPDAGISGAGGSAQSHAVLDISGGKSLKMNFTFAAKDVAIAGPALKGDTYTTKTLSLNLPNLSGAFPDGLAAWQSGRLQTASPLALAFDQGSLALGLDAVPQALLNLGQNKKPGETAKVSLDANVDLARLSAVLKNSLQLAPGLTLTSGMLKHTTTLSTDAQKASLSSTTNITNLAGTRTDPGQPPHPVALHQPIHLELAAADFGGGGAIPELRDLKLNLASSFANGTFAGSSLAAIQGQIIGTFGQLQSELGQFVQMSPQPLGGEFSLMLNSRGDLATAGGKATLTAIASVNHFTRGTQTNLPWASAILSGDLHRGSGELFVDSVQNGSIAVQSNNPQSPTVELSGNFAANFATATATPGILSGVHDATLALTLPNLAALQQLDNALNPPAATTSPASSPLILTGGTVALKANVSHQDAQGGTLLANVSDLSASNVAFSHGGQPYQMKPVHVQLAIAADAGAGSQVRALRVTKLTGDLGVATLSMPTPITLSGLDGDAPAASGAIQFGAKLEEVGPLLAALQGEPDSAFPYAGNLTATQSLKSEQGALGLDGTVQISKFQVLNLPTAAATQASAGALMNVAALASGAPVVAPPSSAPAVAFAEDQIGVTDNVQLRDKFNSITINNLAIAMQSSKALGLTIQHGTIDDLAGARRISLSAQLTYDLAKLWPIIHPMLLTPGQPDDYADVKMAGAFTKMLSLQGAYPANLPFQQAIAQLELNGDLAVGSFSHNGLTVANLDVPTTMSHGTFSTVFPGKPAGQNTAPPATANDGQLDLGNLSVDLTKSPPRLSSATPAMAVLKNVTVNPLFSRFYLAKLINNPVFAGAQQASGLFTLYLDRCANLPMGDLVTQRTAANDGQANLRFSLTNLTIGLQGIGDIASALHQDSFTANVNDGTVAIANGIATQHVVFNTGTYNITFDGKVALDTEQLMPLTVTLPGKRIAQQIRNDPNILKYVPDDVSVVMTGTLDHPHVQMDQVTAKLLASAAKKAAVGNLSGLLGGGGGEGGGGGDATSQPSGQSQDNPLGSLLNGLQKKKKH